MGATLDRRTRRWITAGMSLAAALAFAASPAAAWTLTAAAIGASDGATCLRLATAEPGGALPHDVFCLENPYRVVIDLFGAETPLEVDGAAAVGSALGPVADLRWSLWKNDPAGTVVRYVIETREPVEYAVEENSGELRVRLRSGAAPTAPTVPERPALASADDPVLSDPIPVVADAGPAPADFDPAVAAAVTPSEPPPPAEETAGVPPASHPAAFPSAPVAPLTPASSRLASRFDPQDAAPSLGSVDAGGVDPRAADEAASLTRPMNLDAQGADIRTVVRSIAEYGDANIVADRDVDGPVTVRLSQVPWRKALDIVCASAGLVAVDGANVIRVATAQTWQQEGIDRESAARKNEDLQPLVTRVLPISYAASKELLASITFALSKRGSASVDERTNSLLVSDIESRVAEVEKLVARLDTETLQVEIVARLVDVDETAARQLGIDWNLNNLHSNSERLSGSIGMNEPLATVASGTARVGLVRGWGTLDATIEALERNNQATIISNPRITTVNNRTAHILVGKEVPLIVLDEAGNATTELKKVGIALEVTPYINSDNKITMDLRPEVSDLSSQSTVQGGVVFNTTLADTRVMVNDGETAVIGGLIRKAETTFTQGIPVLKSIPILGALFRSEDKRTENRELMIFVSPRIVQGVAAKN